MSQQEILISITKVTDDETGTYEIGELDFSLHCGPLMRYMKVYGWEGRQELMAMLGTMATHVDRYYKESVTELAQEKAAATDDPSR